MPAISASSRSRRCANWRSRRFAFSRLVSMTRMACSASAISRCSAAPAAADSRTASSYAGNASAAARSSACAASLAVTAASIEASTSARSSASEVTCTGDGPELRGQLRNLRRHPALVLARERELLLESRHFGVRLVEAALLLVQRIARGVVIGAQRLLPGLDGAHLRLQRLQRDGERGHRGGVPLARIGRVLLAREPEHLLRLLQALFERAVFGCDPGLRFEFFQLVGELDPDVLDPREVLAGIGDAPLGFLAPLLVLGDARRLLEEDTQFLGLGLDDAGDHSLLDDGVGPGTEPGPQEQIVDVAPSYRNVVDVVGRVAVAREDALDRDLDVLTPLTADAAGTVVEVQLDRRATHGLALARTVENDVLHRLAAQRRGFRLAKDPTHGVDDVGLAATVRVRRFRPIGRECRWWWDRQTT